MTHAMLAQAESGVGDLFFWSAVLLGLVIVGFAVAVRIKRRLSQAEQGIGPVGFTLSDLRQLHRSGQMSDEEFERAKEKVVEAAKRAADRAAVSAKAQGAAQDPQTNAIRMAAELETLRQRRQQAQERQSPPPATGPNPGAGDARADHRGAADGATELGA